MDSPGHSAQFCTYTMMDQADKDIIAMEIVDKRECSLKATLLEATGFKKAMRDLDSAGVKVVEVVTDAHPQISSIMSNSIYFHIVLFFVVHGFHFGIELSAFLLFDNSFEHV